MRFHDHSDTPHSVRLLWTSDQPVAEAATRQNTTLTRNIHTPGGIRTHNSSKQVAAEPRFSPRGQCQWSINLFINAITAIRYQVRGERWRREFLIVTCEPKRKVATAGWREISRFVLFTRDPFLRWAIKEEKRWPWHTLQNQLCISVGSHTR